MRISRDLSKETLSQWLKMLSPIPITDTILTKLINAAEFIHKHLQTMPDHIKQLNVPIFSVKSKDDGVTSMNVTKEPFETSNTQSSVTVQRFSSNSQSENRLSQSLSSMLPEKSPNQTKNTSMPSDSSPYASKLNGHPQKKSTIISPCKSSTRKSSEKLFLTPRIKEFLVCMDDQTKDERRTC